VAQAVAQARSGKSVRILLVVLSKPSVRSPGPIRWLLLGRSALELLIRDEGRRPLPLNPMECEMSWVSGKRCTECAYGEYIDLYGPYIGLIA